MDVKENYLQNIIADYPSVLFFVGQNSYDALCAALALAHLLLAGNKQTAIYFPHALPSRLSFLNIAPHILTDIVQSDKTAILLNHPQLNLEDMRFEKQNGCLKIILQKTLTAASVRVETGLDLWRAVVGMGINEKEFVHSITSLPLKEAPDLFLIGEPAQNIPAIFEKNTQSFCELMARQLKEHAAEYITVQVATALLAGIILRTQNFQNASLRPQTLFTAAYLISKGADQQTIIQHLYKMKPLELVRLWGRAMANFQYDEGARLATSIVTKQDIAECGANTRHAGMLLTEFMNNFAQAEIFILGVEQEIGGHIALIHSRDAGTAQKICRFMDLKKSASTIAMQMRGDSSLTKKILLLTSELKKNL